MKNIAVVGYGYWGKNLVSNFINLGSCNLKYVYDKNEQASKTCSVNYPNIDITKDFKEILQSDVDGLVIATPVDTHYELAKKALLAGKHVLVEKPMTDSYITSRELQELAIKRKLVLMVDHTFLYTGAVRYLKKHHDQGEFGKINYIDSTRINLGLFQHDVNVLWDLAPHDISIVSYLIDKRPISLQATGISHTDNGIENIAFLTLKYDDKLIVHFNCSWVSPVKMRQMLLGGDKKMVVYNDMEPTEKIKIYDTGFKVRSDKEKKMFIADYRVGDIFVPKVPMTEALSLMAEDFISAINDESTPKSHAQLGVDVVEILEKAELSIKNNGKEISLN
jgi:predicted dehydrogenase